MDLRLSLVSAALMGFAGQAVGQSALIGSVADSATGEPLAGVEVRLPDDNLSAISDANGFFRVDGIESGQHAVYVERDGYRTWAANVTFTVTEGDDVDLGFIDLVAIFEAMLIGVVTDSSTGQPLAGATVTMPDLGLSASTDATGAFVIVGVPGGDHGIVIRQIGFQPWIRQFQLTVVQNMTVDFGPIRISPTEAIEIDPLLVEGELRGSMVMGPFYERMRTEKGTFITAEDIERLNPQDPSELIRRVVGFNTLADGRIASGRGIPSMSDPFEACEVMYFIDGVRAHAGTVNIVIPSTIAGIEIYRGSATTPQIFRGMGNPRCGVIAIWTKDGRPGG